MSVLYIIIPAYNESANINMIVDMWYPVVEKYNGGGQSKLLIIDDGSKDNTFDIIKEKAQGKPLLEPIKKKNEGHGATVLYGYKFAIRNGADFVFQTDADGQTIPEDFEQFWELRNEYDLIIGHRKNREDGIARIIVTKVLKLVVKLCFKVNAIDANTPFRLMRVNSLAENIKFIPPNLTFQMLYLQ